MCQETLNSDYRQEHNRRYHKDLIYLRKSIPFRELTQPLVSNPFIAAASLGGCKRPSENDETTIEPTNMKKHCLSPP